MCSMYADIKTTPFLMYIRVGTLKLQNFTMRISLIFILSFTYIAVAQNIVGQTNLDSLAKAQIRQLHDGALFVRLHSRKGVIEALLKRGQTTQAAELEKQQWNANSEIIAAFKTAFNFCPVYFFYSEYSGLVLDKRFDTAFFLNAGLNVDTTIQFKGRNFFCAEIGNMESEVTYEKEPFYYVPNDKAAAEKAGYFDDEKKPQKGGDGAYSGTESLVIQNDQFIQLKSPFPFYQRTKFLVFNMQMRDVVKNMNGALIRFYNSCNRAQ